MKRTRVYEVTVRGVIVGEDDPANWDATAVIDELRDLALVEVDSVELVPATKVAGDSRK